MPTKSVALSAAAMFLLAGPVLADGGPVPEAPSPAATGWYADLHGGAVWQKDIGIDAFGDFFRTETDTGWAAGGALGYRYGDGLRSEFEGTYRKNEGDFLFIDPVTGPEPNGTSDYSALNLMVNMLYDFDMGYAFSPYIGAGIGASRIDLELSDGTDTENDDAWAFAYQFIGGFSIPMPNTAFEFFADYRYLSTAGFDLDFGDQVKDLDEYESHTVMGGARFNF